MPNLVAGVTVKDWEEKWQTIGVLKDSDFSPFKESAGLYRARLVGKIVYIGRAIEISNGGIRKRLADYTRENDSARKHPSGVKMYKNRASLIIDILETGNDDAAVSAAQNLEPLLVAKYKPEWNDMLK
tara:strand:- start:86201 stop:86584 length:384 start_codon:yes stop_codon:yes gene_type:complete